MTNFGSIFPRSPLTKMTLMYVETRSYCASVGIWTTRSVVKSVPAAIQAPSGMTEPVSMVRAAVGSTWTSVSAPPSVSARHSLRSSPVFFASKRDSRPHTQ